MSNKIIDGGQTSGHSARQGGLRGHSVGQLYPSSVIAIGHPHQWAAYNNLTGVLGTRWDDIELTVCDAQLDKLLYELERDKLASIPAVCPRGFYLGLE